MIAIPKSEFCQRIERIQEALAKDKLDAMMVYGDEYRRENLRYVSNFWPIFERGACFVPRKGDPVLAGAPEGERYAREMCPWEQVLNIKEFACVSVPEEIDYPLATFSSLKAILADTLQGGKRLGLVGKWDIPAPIFERVRGALPNLEIVESDSILRELRLIKSPNEIACLREAGRLACVGYEKLMAAAVPGNTELMSAGAAEGAALGGRRRVDHFYRFRQRRADQHHHWSRDGQDHPGRRHDHGRLCGSIPGLHCDCGIPVRGR